MRTWTLRVINKARRQGEGSKALQHQKLQMLLQILLMIKSCITSRTLNYGNYGIFLIMGAGFISSTVPQAIRHSGRGVGLGTCGVRKPSSSACRRQPGTLGRFRRHCLTPTLTFARHLQRCNHPQRMPKRALVCHAPAKDCQVTRSHFVGPRTTT